MYSYLLKRISLAFLTLFIILFASYMLIRFAPGDPTKSSIFSNGEAQTLSADKSDLAKNNSMRSKLHLDKPKIVGFAYWIKNIFLHGDFGSSVAVDIGRPVTSLIVERLPITIKLNIISIFIIYLFSIPIGINSAITKNKKSDKVIVFFLFVLYSLPGAWVPLVLQALTCEGGKFSIFPLKGTYVDDQYGVGTFEYFYQSGKHYILPVICMCYAGFAGLSKYAKEGMVDVIQQDYIRTARAKGVSEWIVIFKHALRNSMILLVTLFAGLLPGLISGSIIVEYIFNIQGMGALSIMALSSRDIPLMMTLFAFGGTLTLVGILFSDLMYVIIDPRITFDSKK